ncbi:hypothetical protein, partial [Nostoc commune]|uniref:hypothetical protein n=1 Tax=Nostoc commune TaxID=1178 RepID=UPI001E310DDD
VCQNHFDGWRDAINRRLYSKSIRQLFLDTLLVGCWDSRSIANCDVYDGLRLCNFPTAHSLLLQHKPPLVLPRDMCNQSPQEFYQLQFIL